MAWVGVAWVLSGLVVYACWCLYFQVAVFSGVSSVLWVPVTVMFWPVLLVGMTVDCVIDAVWERGLQEGEDWLPPRVVEKRALRSRPFRERVRGAVWRARRKVWERIGNSNSGYPAWGDDSAGAVNDSPTTDHGSSLGGVL